jgi:hypothetical protein
MGAIDLVGFVKKLALPPGFVAPAALRHDGIEAAPLTRADLAEDVAAVNASRALIERTRGGRWPGGPVSEEEDYVDLVWHEQELREGNSFAYVVRDGAGAYLGCFYLYPLGLRTDLTEGLLDHDIDVSWWVTPDAYERGYYRRLYVALGDWLADELPFERPFYSNAEIPPG